MAFNSGYRVRRANDTQGLINPQIQYLQQTSPRPFISTYSVQGSGDTVLDTAGGQTVIVTGGNFATGVSAILDGTPIGSVTLVNSSQITFTSPAKAGGSYTLIVYNPSSDAAAVLVPGLIYSAVPQWTTPAGSIGSYYETTAIDTSVVATSDSPITYAVTSGSIPTGSTFYANGVMTGTAPVDSGSTTYTFAVTATDAESQDTTRTFTLTVNTDVVTWVTPSSGSTISLDASAYSLTLNATDAAGYSVGYTANALPSGLSLSAGVISGTATTEGSTTTLLTATAATTGRSSTNTVTWVVTLGDIYWNYVTTLLSTQTPSPEPFIADASLNNSVITINGDTRPNNYNPYTPGYYSFNFTAKTQYVSVPATTALTTYTGDFTFEAWIYPSDTSITFWYFWDSRQNGASPQPMVIGLAPLSSPVTGQGRMSYFNGSTSYGTGIVYYNRWTHVAYVRSGSTMTFYINGVASGTATVSGTQTGSATSNPIWIGTKDNGSASYGSTGYISNLRVVNGTAVYTSNFTPSTTPLPVITNTVLLTAQDNSFVDESAASRVLTPSSATISGFNPFATEYVKNTPYYSGYFDGTGDYLTIPTNAALNITSGSTDSFVCELWVNFSTVGANMSIVDNGGLNTVSFSNWDIRLNASSQITINWGNSAAPGSNIGTLASSTVPVVGQWYHIALVKTNADWSLFINGTRAVTYNGLNTAQKSSATALYIGFGISTGAGGTGFAGSISNVRIYKGDTASAPYSATSSTITVPTSPLTSITNTQLLTCQSSTFIDNSTNNFAITVNGNTSPITASPFTDPGYSSTVVSATYGSTYFDGTGDWLTVPYSSAFDTGTTYTIETYVYPTILNAQNYIFNISNSNVSSFGGWLLWVNSSGSIYFECRPSTGGTNVQVIGGTVRLNAWSHVAVVVNSNAVKIFLNGSQVATGTVVALNGTQTNVGIGALTNGATATPWNGYISNVRLVKGTAVYTTPFIPPTEPLTAISGTSLLTCQSNQPFNNNVFLDSSTNNFLVTRNGNTAQGTFSPYGENWSNYFDGSGDYLTLPNNQAVFSMGTGNFTIEMWIYVTSLSSARTLYDTMNAGDTTGTGRFALQLSTGGTVQIFTGAGSILTSGGTVSISTWYHLAVTKASNSTRIFLNGTQVNSTYTDNNNYVVGTTARPIIGVNAYDNSTNPMFGYISNIRVVKGTALYTSSFTPSTTPLQAIVGTSLLTCQSPGLVDDSPNNFAITKTGDVSVQKFGPFAGTTLPTPYYSGYFDGSGDWLTIPNSTGFAFGSGDFTVELWVYVTGSTGTVANYSNGQSSNTNFAWELYQVSATVMQFSVFSGSTQYISSSSSFTVNSWNHIACVRSSNTLKTYINGTAGATTASLSGVTVSDPASSTLKLCSYGNGSAYVTGYISNFRVVKGTAVYTTNFTPPTAPLTAISGTSLLTCQSNTFVDNSTNNFAITANGNSQPTTVNPFTLTYSTKQSYTPSVYGGSMYFDGSGDYLDLPNNTVFSQVGSWTLELWVYPTVATNNYVYSQATTNFLQINISGTNYVNIDRSGVGNLIVSSNPISLNTWTHIALVSDGTNMKLFINGTQSGSTAAVGTQASSATTTRIGAYQSNGSLAYQGYISDLRLVKGTALYTSNFVPQNQPLTPVTNTTLLLNGTSAGVYDSSENNDFETVADAKVAQFGPYNAGYYSNYFDGTGDSLTTPANAGFGFGTGDFTVEFWINFSSTANRQDLVWWGTSGSDRGGLIWNITAGNLTYYISPTVANAINYTWTPAASTWYHIALVRSAGSTKLYINGVQGGSTYSDSKNYSTSNLVTIAQDSSAASSYFNGYMSNLRIVKGTAVYTSNFTPPTSPLTAISGTSLLTCQSNRFIDNSTNNFTITRNGDTKVATQNPFQNNSGQSYYFDGTGDYLLASSTAANQSTAFGTGNFTVEFWVNATSNSGTQQFFDTRPSGTSSTSQYMALTYLSGSLNYYTAGANPAISGGAVTPGVWNHIALTRSGTSTRLFVNGTQVGSTYTDSQSYLGSINRPIIASDGNSPGTANLTGYISDLRITKGIARYTSTFTPPTAALKTS